MELKKHFSKDRFSLRQVIGMLTAVIVGATALAYASVTIPYTFTSGSTASSTEVNANFQALANAINNRTSATLANMAGTWSYTSFGSSLSGDNLCTVTHFGTLTLNADGTFSEVEPDTTNSCVSGASGTSGVYTNTGGTYTGTWTVLADGSGTLNAGGLTIPFQASRDLNIIVASRSTTSGNGKTSITAVRQ